MRKNIVEYFEEAETRQEYKGYFCSIPEAIRIVVLGNIYGLRNISQIHQWAESESVIGFLKEKFGIEHIPCYYWLLSLLKLIKPESLNKCLMKWAEAMLPEERKGLTVSLDGKTVRSTSKMESYDSPLHIISAQISELGITFASKSVEGKSNEIPAVQQLIDELDIRDCLVTADALNCQRETAEAIIRGKGDYLLDAKGVKIGEWHYYISSRTLTSLELLHHARMEWAVDSMHWILDVHYSEDFFRIVNRTIQQNLNAFRKVALSMIKQFKADSNSKRPLSQIMFNCLLNPSDICTILENWFPCTLFA